MIAAAGAGAWVYMRVGEPYRGYEGPEQIVEVPSGAGSRAIGDRLVAAGVVRDALSFRLGLYLSGEARRLQAGEYRFDRAMTPMQVIDKLARGDVYVLNITFPEGLTVAEMAKIFETQKLGSAAAFVEAAGDPSPIKALDPEARDLEGYLFPETYPLPRNTPASRLIRQMTDRFEQVMTPDLRQAAEAKGLTVRQAVTLASIIEKEASRQDERPLVAAVYANRLRIGMPLQADPTVIFAFQRAGKYTGNLRRDDLGLRLSVQHLSLSRAAAGAHRIAGPRGDRSRGQSRGRGLSVLREPQRRFARVRPDARRAQPERAEVAGAVLQG